jgi:hypothetical protein
MPASHRDPTVSKQLVAVETPLLASRRGEVFALSGPHPLGDNFCFLMRLGET